MWRIVVSQNNTNGVGASQMQSLVGPVLTASPLGVAVAKAILEQNPNVTLIDRGAYLRLLVPGRCLLCTATVERILGNKFEIPASLEAVMPSFQGRIRWAEGEVEWT